MKIGDVVNFSILGENHTAKVQLVYQFPADPTREHEPKNILFACRRINNGSLVLAWGNELAPDSL